MNLKSLLITGLVSAFATLAQAQVPLSQVKKLSNNKEVLSRSLKRSDRMRIEHLALSEGFKSDLTDIFYRAVHEYVNVENYKCEFHLLDIVKKHFEQNHLATDLET